jgi:hypothetical protein
METKKFDAVQFMRQARDRMSEDMRGMSFEEQRAYIEQHASKARKDLDIPSPRQRRIYRKFTPPGRGLS